MYELPPRIPMQSVTRNRRRCSIFERDLIRPSVGTFAHRIGWCSWAAVMVVLAGCGDETELKSAKSQLAQIEMKIKRAKSTADDANRKAANAENLARQAQNRSRHSNATY